MNPRISLLLASSVLAASLAGCSPNQATTSTDAAADTALAETTTTGTASTTAVVPTAGSTAEEVLAANAEVHSSDLGHDRRMRSSRPAIDAPPTSPRL